jgi:DNA-binding winged helix-turn-helix (wHTH) protein
MSNFRAMFGDLVIDGSAWEARLNDTILGLTPTEFEVLMVLASRPRQVIAGDELVRLVWGDGWFGDDNNLAVHVSKLRRKLGESGQHPRFIHTVRGVGYRFDPGEDHASGGSVSTAEYEALRGFPGAVEVLTDGQLRVISVRPDEDPVLGFEPRQLLGRYFPVVDHDLWRDHASALDGIRVLISSGVREWSARHIARRADGARVHADTAACLQVDNVGQLQAMHFVILERGAVAAGSLAGGGANAGQRAATRIA